jgi:two-component system, OmpR family, osmolarity sensor histidine kinase EnvZ
VLRLKRYMPKSLFGRSLLIIVLPIALMQIAVTYVFFEAHWQTVTSRLSDGVAGDLSVILDLYERDTSAGNLAQIDADMRRALSISTVWEEDGELPLTTRDAVFRAVDRTIRRALSEKLDQPFWFDTTRYRAYVEIRVKVENGVLRFVVPRERVVATTGHIFILWILVATVVLTGISLIYIRNQAKPIERLAKAADAFGRGEDMPGFRPTGASEVRSAANAFIQMKARIRRHMEQRSTLLASVSHDLRTPLTRMRLQLALLEASPEREELLKDVADMEAIVGEYLAFARGVSVEDMREIDLVELVHEALEAASIKREVAIEMRDDPLLLRVRPVSLKRCLVNLINNASNHGDGLAIRLEEGQQQIRIHIDDDGPGIPPERREEAFAPFSRLNPHGSRNPDGVGLGLAIARDIARAHGGDIVLCEAPQGGLRATVRLPV